MRVKFICGCLSPDIVNRENLLTMDSVGYDEEGFLQCTSHHVRRYGWKSLPTVNGNDSYADYTYSKYTPLEIEAIVVFDEIVEPKSLQVKFDKTVLSGSTRLSS